MIPHYYNRRRGPVLKVLGEVSGGCAFAWCRLRRQEDDSEFFFGRNIISYERDNTKYLCNVTAKHLLLYCYIKKITEFTDFTCVTDVPGRTKIIFPLPLSRFEMLVKRDDFVLLKRTRVLNINTMCIYRYLDCERIK